MKSSKFDTLFNKIINECKLINEEESPWKNEEYVYEWIRHDFKVVIAKNTEDDGSVSYEFILGKIDRDTDKVYDWPYFESSNEFETMEEAIDAAEDYIRDLEYDEDNDGLDDDPAEIEPDQGEEYMQKDLNWSSANF